MNKPEIYGNFLYIDPNATDNDRDIPQAYEDYCLSVDLIIESGNRYWKNKGILDKKVAKKISFFMGDNGELTTKWTNITGGKDEEAINEAIGIESIDIQFDMNIAPQVSIKFVDVRGSALMQPEERVRKEKDNPEMLGGSFFQSLLRIPSPVFKLIIKGYYGKEIGYELAVTKFSSSFNNANGNFDVTVNFLGYMYGLFTDIPMTLIAAAPYTKYGKKYWEKMKESTFRFDVPEGGKGEGIPLYTFQEYRKVLAEATSEASKVTEQLPQGAAYKKDMIAINNLNVLLGDMRNAYSVDREDNHTMFSQIISFAGNGSETDLCIYTFNNEIIQGMKAGKEQVAETINYPLWKTFLKNVKGLKATDYFPLKGIPGNFITMNEVDDASTYENYLLISKTGFIGDKLTMKDKDVPLFYCNFDKVDGKKKKSELKNIYLNTAAENILRTYNKEKGDLITKLKELDFTGETLCGTLIDTRVAEREINIKITELTKTVDALTDSLDKAMAHEVTKLLHFKPTIGNFFRMLFAHLETLLVTIYNTVEIACENNHGERNGDKFEYDKADCKLGKDLVVPPFPMFYEKSNDRKEHVEKYVEWTVGEGYKGDRVLPERELIDNLILGAAAYGYERTEVDKILANKSFTNNGLGENTPMGQSVCGYTGIPNEKFKFLEGWLRRINSFKFENKDTDENTFYNEFFPILLQHEGTKFVDDPADKGGPTMCGITLATYQSIAGADKTVDDLKKLTKDSQELKDIYKKHFWDTMRADEFKNASIAKFLVDFAVNSGPGRAASKLQILLGLEAKNYINDETIAAANAYDTQEKLFNGMVQDRIAYVYSICGLKPIYANSDDISNLKNIDKFIPLTRRDYVFCETEGNPWGGFSRTHDGDNEKEVFGLIVAMFYSRYIAFCSGLQQGSKEKDVYAKAFAILEAINFIKANPMGNTSIKNAIGNGTKEYSHLVNGMVQNLDPYNIYGKSTDKNFYHDCFTSLVLSKVELGAKRKEQNKTFAARENGKVEKYTKYNWIQNNITKDYMFPLDAKIIGDKEITFADDDIYAGEVLSNNSARFISVQNPLATPNSYFIIDNVGAGDYIEEYNNKIREISCEDYGFTTNTLSNTDINKWMKSMYLTDKEEKISSVGGEYLEEAKTKSWFKRLFSSDDGKDIIKPFRISTDRDVDSDEMQVNSLFFHPLYYLQDEAPAGFFEGDDNYTASEKVALARAYLIAMSISCKLRPSSNSNDNYFKTSVPALLKEGAILWYQINGDNKCVYFGDKFKSIPTHALPIGSYDKNLQFEFKILSENSPSTYTDIPEELKYQYSKNLTRQTELIEYFKAWALNKPEWMEKSILSAPEIADRMEIFSYDGNKITYKDFERSDKGIYIIKGESGRYDLENYYIGKVSNKATQGLYNDREFTKELKEYFLNREATAIDLSIFNTSMGYENVDSAVRMFFQCLTEYYAKPELVDMTDVLTAVTESHAVDAVNNDQRKALYATVKHIYDRWLCANTKDKWIIPNSTDKNANTATTFNTFHFWDCDYHDVSQTVIVSPSNFSEKLEVMLGSINAGTPELIIEQNYNFYTFLESILSDCGMNLLSLPMELGTTEEDMELLFKAIPYIEKNKTTSIGPAFIGFYNPSLSSKLNLLDGDFMDDSYKITDSESCNNEPKDENVEIVTDISYKRMDTSLSNRYIPAFGVTYAKGNQSYFRNINVNMDNPVVTDASIKYTENIAAQGAEGPNTTSFYGQDMYRVYSEYAYTCTVEMMGNMQIAPLMYFQLNNIPMFSGTYMIYKVSHSLQNGNMTTTFIGNRVTLNEHPTAQPGLIFFNPDQIDLKAPSMVVTGGKATYATDALGESSAAICEYLRNMDTSNIKPQDIGLPDPCPGWKENRFMIVEGENVSDEILSRQELLMNKVLNKLRVNWHDYAKISLGKDLDIFITSAYRSHAHNENQKRHYPSAHEGGMAVDIVVSELTNGKYINNGDQSMRTKFQNYFIEWVETNSGLFNPQKNSGLKLQNKTNNYGLGAYEVLFEYPKSGKSWAHIAIIPVDEKQWEEKHGYVNTEYKL